MQHRSGLRHILIFLACFPLLLSSCTGLPRSLTAPEYSFPDWAYTDLRGIDPPDATQPEQDILAGYLRRTPLSRNGLDIRLDFLDLSLDAQQNLLLAFDFLPGGVDALPSGAPTDLEWDALLELPSGDPIQGYDRELQPLGGLAVQQLHNPEQDSLQVILDGGAFFGGTLSGLPPGLKVQAFTTSPENGEVIDGSPVLRLSAGPPLPARLLLAFWNTFPAATPAQSLRRWDGAHTGLFGGRSGLFNLLRLARNYDVPVVLLDLNTPASLSALDYAGDLDLVKSLISTGIVSAPQVWLGSDGDELAWLSTQWAEQFGLPTTDLGYAKSTDYLPDRYRLAFLPDNLAKTPITQVHRSATGKIVLLPTSALQDNPALSLTPDGFSIAARQFLATSAAQPSDASTISVLGGDLAQSGWGSPEAARRAFSYIQDHPWIRIVHPNELASAQPVAVHEPRSLPRPAFEAQLAIDLPAASSNPLDQAAAHSLWASSVSAIPASPQFLELKNIYDSQARVLLAAARWSEDPAGIATCDEDIDLDGASECILASETIFSVFDLELGALTHAFTLGEDGPHQWIAPSSQLTYGTGDPAEWDLTAGLAADPTVIPGAFADPPTEDSSLYLPKIQPGKLILASPDGGQVKTFTLLENGLSAEIVGLTSPARLPLVIDPWLRFQPGWGEWYRAQQSDGTVNWGTEEFQVSVSSPQRLILSAFNDTRQLMGRVENPNAEYPPGHYLPFPLALVEADGESSLSLKITLQTK